MKAKSKKQQAAVAIAEAAKQAPAIPNTAPSPSTPMPSAPAMPRVEAVPGMMATRNALRGMRADSIRHIPKSQRRGK